MSRGKLLLVEDERALVLALTDRLESEGWSVESTGSARQALEMAARAPFDLLILDVGLPDGNGFDVCRDLRGSGNGVPILMLTAKGQVIDKVLGLKLGADDYLTKPFDAMELLARIEALLRRSVNTRPAEGSRRFGEVEIDLRSAEVRKGSNPVDLSALEYRLLCYFADHPDELLTRERLLDEVWGYESTPYTRTVDVHVASLRQKIEPNPSRPRHIETVHGLGYRFRL